MCYTSYLQSICSHGLRHMPQFFTQKQSVVTTCTNCTSHVWYSFKSVSHCAFTDIITWHQWPYDTLIANNLNSTCSVEKIIRWAIKLPHWIIEMNANNLPDIYFQNVLATTIFGYWTSASWIKDQNVFVRWSKKPWNILVFFLLF